MTTLIDAPAESWAGQYIGTHDALGRPQLVMLVTIQFAVGGLIDAEPVGDLIHLNANHSPSLSTTLCGIEMFSKGGKPGPGWSRGGGVTGPGMTHRPCPGCATVAADTFPGLPVHRDIFKLDWSRP